MSKTDIIMPFSVYILYSSKNDKYYIGQTSNLELRILFHNEVSKTSYTSKYRPWEIYHSFEMESRSKAMQFEKYLKKKPRSFIRRLKNDKQLQQFLLEKYNAG